MKKKGLKKLSLNKDAIAKLNNAEMGSLRGGYATYINVSPPPPAASTFCCSADTVVGPTITSFAFCLAGDCCSTVNK